MQEHVELAAALVLGRVDATEEQQVEVKRIVADTLGGLQPLAEQHRANRDALHTELGRDAIDPVVIEQLRQSEMALADSASRELSGRSTKGAWHGGGQAASGAGAWGGSSRQSRGRGCDDGVPVAPRGPPSRGSGAL